MTAVEPDPTHESGGYAFFLRPPDVAKLREIPAWRAKTDEEIVGDFFTAQAPRWAESLSDTLPGPAEIRVVVDPYTRQAFLACGPTVYSIVSF